jgi:ADP-heptose:LPS heptosyltransferase
MLPDAWQAVQRVLVIQTGEGDDGTALLPALKVLREALPGVQMTLLHAPSQPQSDRLLLWVDAVLPHPALELKTVGVQLSDVAIQDLVAMLRQSSFDAAIVFTQPHQSPYPLAYLCYLAGIPLRLGQSQEFGGGVLSHCIAPQPEVDSLAAHHLFLLETAGFAAALPQSDVISTPMSAPRQ